MGPQPPLVTIADLKLNKIKFSNFVQNCNFFALKIVQKQKLEGQIKISFGVIIN